MRFLLAGVALCALSSTFACGQGEGIAGSAGGSSDAGGGAGGTPQGGDTGGEPAEGESGQYVIRLGSFTRGFA